MKEVCAVRRGLLIPFDSFGIALRDCPTFLGHPAEFVLCWGIILICCLTEILEGFGVILIVQVLNALCVEFLKSWGVWVLAAL